MQTDDCGRALSDEASADLYADALYSLGKRAQDILCRRDEQHAWGRAWQEAVMPPLSSTPYAPGDEPVDMTFYVRTRRRCLNCGKEQVIAPAPEAKP